MKRTLLEILAAMAVVVLLVSFHHQITRLKSQNGDVAQLRRMVREAVSRANDGAEQHAARRAALADLTNQMAELEAKISEDALSREETEALRRELAQTKLAADRFQAEIERDVLRTKELVDAYHREAKALDQQAAAHLTETQSSLQELAERFLPDPGRLDRELLAPTVQLNGDDTVGSGTLVYSAPREDASSEDYETYVITSYHVVRNILADTRSARRDGISVTIYTANGLVEERADMVSQDELIDAALLQLRTKKRYTNVAKAITRQRAGHVRVWERVYTVGCPLGNDPIPTRGEISSVNNRLNGTNYWMINAPTYFGNSGGGVYLAESRELAGVFSKIYTHGRGNPTVVPHMGLCTPMDSIYAWLERDGMEFVLEGSRTAPELELEIAAKPPGN